ncbi:helix-turn-helix transcriptional regulator [Streptomyces sp. JV185]|uniref:helix-turn-helix domain-containing protein n=1 Tax=Streptomyces sp. JV185 TaxID=858638 RepID=UPI002E7A7B8D|nr:helix-turn-helix transcriptional regulator [Streptomyces sp. JV185]MEE1772596.1 helix-turn-helix transcriptional regulator [Streptomyces sp. JV185]
MGRKENPVDYTVRLRGALAEQLRELRHNAGLTYDELAATTGLSPATLKRACSGTTTPTEEVVVRIAEACDATKVNEAKAQWRRARRTERGLYDKNVGHTRPLLFRTPAELAAGFANLYEVAGAPPLRVLHDHGKEWLACSSAALITKGKMLPSNEGQLITYLKGCGVSPTKLKEWVVAWITLRPGVALRSVPPQTRRGGFKVWADEPVSPTGARRFPQQRYAS